MLHQTSNMYQVQELHTYLFLVPWISKILQDALHLNLFKLCNQSKINYEVDSLLLHKKIWTLCTWILHHSKSELWTRKPLSAILLFGRTMLWSLSGHEFVRVFQSADIAIVTTSWYWLQQSDEDFVSICGSFQVHPSNWQHFTKLHMAGSCQRWIRSILVTHVPQLGWPQMSTDLVFLQSKHGPRCPVCNIVPVHIYEVSERTPHNSLKVTFVSVPAIAQ
jgi:hypothetical protein